MIIGSSVCCVLIGNIEVYYKNGVFFGYNLIIGVLVFYNQFDDLLLGLYVVIFGIIGSGKFMMMKIMLVRSVVFGFWVCVFDLEGEYKKLINMFGGKYVEVKVGGKVGINLFDLEIEEDEGKRFINIEGKILEIRFLFGIILESFMGKKLDGIYFFKIE